MAGNVLSGESVTLEHVDHRRSRFSQILYSRQSTCGGFYSHPCPITVASREIDPRQAV